MMNRIARPVAAISILLWCGQAAEAQARREVGSLTCRLAPSIGLIIGSRQSMTCRFTRGGGRTERYSGTVTRFGLDLGVTAGGVMAWSVLKRTTSTGRGALAGHYVG